MKVAMKYKILKDRMTGRAHFGFDEPNLLVVTEN